MEVLLIVSKNVMIPHDLFMRVVDLLEYWDIPDSHDLRFEYFYILRELKVKIQRLELRDTYSKIISAKNENDRFDARIEYMRKRSSIRDVDVPDMPS